MNINDLSYEHQQAIEAMKDQLIIVLVNRLGGETKISVSEIDDTGRFNLRMKLKSGVFQFVTEEKTREQI